MQLFAGIEPLAASLVSSNFLLFDFVSIFLAAVLAPPLFLLGEQFWSFSPSDRLALPFLRAEDALENNKMKHYILANVVLNHNRHFFYDWVRQILFLFLNASARQ